MVRRHVRLDTTWRLCRSDLDGHNSKIGATNHSDSLADRRPLSSGRQSGSAALGCGR